MELKRVVVTGMGALTPLGNSVPDFWKNLVGGTPGAAPITRFDASKFRTQFACEVKNFNVEDFIDRKEARRMDIFTHFALVSVDEALNDSGLLQQSYNPDRVGVLWGAGIGGLRTFQEEVVGFAKGDGTPRFNPFFIPKMIADSASGQISIKYGFRGINLVTVSACASSSNSIMEAMLYLRMGKLDVCITGGSEAAVTEAGIGGFNAMKALSERNDDPQTASRPYDKDRDGFVLGEGGGALILETLEHAQARGAKIYAELVGAGSSSDAYHITAPHPEGEGARNSMKWALEDANLAPEDIDYINTHGTSTPIGDPQEIKAIQSLFGEHAYRLNISSTKSMHGHLLGGTGAVEAIASIMSITQGIVPPTINHFTDDEAIDANLNFTYNTAQERVVRASLSNTFGFGGHNCTLIFRKFEL
jgi:3-oxoacyl-[acyl-carrier-protein] synthase II